MRIWKAVVLLPISKLTYSHGLKNPSDTLTWQLSQKHLPRPYVSFFGYSIAFKRLLNIVCIAFVKIGKKNAGKVGSEIISVTAFLHLDTKWEWPGLAKNKEGKRQALVVRGNGDNLLGKKAHFPKRQKERLLLSYVQCASGLHFRHY